MNNEQTKEAAQLILEKTKAGTTETKASPEKPKQFLDLLKAMRPAIEKAVPRQLGPERFLRIAQTAFSSNPKLQQAEPMTIISGLMLAVQMGLEVNTPLGQAYLIPYYNNKTRRMEAQFQAGYQGILSLAYRTNLYKNISAHEVYPNDRFEYALGLNRKLEHIPANIAEGEPVYYYAVYQTVTGGDGFVVWSHDKVLKHAKKFSKSFNKTENKFFGPWHDNFPAMAKKTVLLDLMKYAPKSIEIERFLAQEGVTRETLDEDMGILPSITDYSDQEGE